MVLKILNLLSLLFSHFHIVDKRTKKQAKNALGCTHLVSHSRIFACQTQCRISFGKIVFRALLGKSGNTKMIFLHVDDTHNYLGISCCNFALFYYVVHAPDKACQGPIGK